VEDCLRLNQIPNNSSRLAFIRSLNPELLITVESLSKGRISLRQLF
jgi:hypothetical protein